MRHLLLAVSVAVVASACGLFGGGLGGGAAGGTFTLAITGKQGTNFSTDKFEAKTVTGFYNSKGSGMAGDGGWSIITGTPSLLDSTTCKSLSLGFWGPPTEGTTIVLDLPEGLDGGRVNETGRGQFVAIDGCITKGDVNTWRSNGGTLVFDSVAQAKAAGATTQKTLAFHYAVTMAPSEDSKGATGTFSGSGTGEVDLFAE